MSPFGDYEDWDDCISKNRNKGNPEAYCGKIKHQVEDYADSKCVFKTYDVISEKNPDIPQKRRLDLSYKWCEKRSVERDFKEFVCHEFWDFMFEDLSEIYEDTILERDFYGEMNTRIEDAMRGAEAGSMGARKGGAKRTKVGQSLVKQLGESVFEIGSPENFMKVGEELLPIPTLSGQSQRIRGKPSMTNRPLTPVSSSVVKGRAVLGNKLYIQFHSNPNKIYKYTMPSPEAAAEAFEEIVQGSPGRWVWNNLRGHTLGPVFGNPSRKTQGGTTASLVPYDKLTFSRVRSYLNEIPSYNELSEKWRKYKMAVKGQIEGATSGEPFMVEEIEKFQEEIKKKHADRKKLLDELRGEFKSRGIHTVEIDMKRVNDNFNELIEWVLAEGITTDRKEAKIIAWKIANSKKNPSNKSKSGFGKKKEKEEKEEDWKSAWSKIGAGFDKQREERLKKWGWAYEKRGKGRPRKQGRPKGKKDLLMEDLNESESLISKAHEKYMKKQEESLKKSIEWSIHVDKTRGIETSYEEALSKFDPPRIPLNFSINNAVNYLKEFYELKLSKAKIKEQIKEHLPISGKGEFSVTFRGFMGSDDGYKGVSYDKYSLDVIDKFGSFLSQGKGRGWHGEPERHSQAAKKGKKHDLMEEIHDLELQLQQKGFDIEQIREEYELWVN